MSGDYIYDRSWDHERERLQGLERAYDDATISLLERVGVDDRWRCLEVGGGAGSIASWLADRVGPGGSVIATDTDTRFLRMLETPNLTVLEHDITTDDPLPGPFDLVHSRALLAHLPERQAVVTRMVSAVRPGGWIVIEDVDFASVTPLDPDPAFDHLVTAMTTLMERAGIDRGTGRKLRRMLVAAGLKDAVSEGRVRVIDGSNPMGSLTFETLGPRIVSAGLLGQEEVDSVLNSMKDPTYEWVSPVMFAAWGRRGGA